MIASGLLRAPRRAGAVGAGPLILLALIAAEVAVFSRIGTRFATVENLFEVVRLAVEVGLLAVALTPVIVAGGIDLSVGSLMGLAAVAFGLLWRDAHLSIPVAAGLTLLLGALAGGLNGAIVTRLGVAPLIVTLGTFSLYRGLAEGLTGGVDNFTGFPAGFLALGQGYLAGGVPAQVPIFLIAAVGMGLLLGRTTIGRAWVAIGSSPEGARFAGLPVGRRIGLTYVLSGALSSLAALIYVAHLGQAKADVGLGYELAAITAVVLGGTSIFGGRGTVGGTILGLTAIVVLRRGLQLAALPAELAGIVTGALLLVAIGLDRFLSGRRRPVAPATASLIDPEVFAVKNAQVAVICLSILLAGAIVAATNALLIRQLATPGATTPGPTTGFVASPPGPAPELTRPAPAPARRVTVAMMPKSKGNAYFRACRVGAEAAAQRLGVDLIWDGPTDPDPAQQNEVVDAWITRGVDVIAVAVENRSGISSVLRKAQARGIRVLTWDADADADARSFFVNQATPEGIAEALMAEAGKVLGAEGRFAIITGSLTAGNMVAWQQAIEVVRAARYPGLTMAALRACDDLQQRAFDEATTLMAADPAIRLFVAICTPAVPGAAEAVRQAGRRDVRVVGLGLPNDNKPYVREGITPAVILWKTADLGDLTVAAARALALGELAPGATEFTSDRLGRIAIRGDNILLGKPFAFTRENIDSFDF